MGQIYDAPYYQVFAETSRKSAEAIVPVVMELLAPASVVDLGCGLGAWLAVFRRHGVGDIQGVDGSYVSRDQLMIPEEAFTAYDLSTPYISSRRYNLAISLEVAEHLPEASGRTLVNSLVHLAPVVLFSAAVPYQPGTNHVNCQWPEYWAELFARYGFVAIDTLRTKFWRDPRVDWWYRQNLLIFAQEEKLGDWPALQRERTLGPDKPRSLVHPEMFLQVYSDLVAWGADWEKKYWDLWGQKF